MEQEPVTALILLCLDWLSSKDSFFRSVTEIENIWDGVKFVNFSASFTSYEKSFNVCEIKLLSEGSLNTLLLYVETDVTQEQENQNHDLTQIFEQRNRMHDIDNWRHPISLTAPPPVPPPPIDQLNRSNQRSTPVTSSPAFQMDTRSEIHGIVINDSARHPLNIALFL